MPDQEKGRKREKRPSAATVLVKIAGELYTFHRTAETRSTAGDVVSEGYLYARLKDNPDRRFRLEEIRPTTVAGSPSLSSAMRLGAP